MPISNTDIKKSSDELADLYLSSNKRSFLNYSDPKGIAMNTAIGGISGAGLGALIGLIRERASSDPEATGLNKDSLKTILTSALLGGAGGGGLGFLASDRRANKAAAEEPINAGSGAVLGEDGDSKISQHIPYIDYQDGKLTFKPKIIYSDDVSQSGVDLHVRGPALHEALIQDAQSITGIIGSSPNPGSPDYNPAVIEWVKKNRPGLIDDTQASGLASGHSAVLGIDAIFGSDREERRGLLMSLGWDETRISDSATALSLLVAQKPTMLHPEFGFDIARQRSVDLTGDPTKDLRRDQNGDYVNLNMNGYFDGSDPDLETLYPRNVGSDFKWTNENLTSMYTAHNNLNRRSGKPAFPNINEWANSQIKPGLGQVIGLDPKAADKITFDESGNISYTDQPSWLGDALKATTDTLAKSPRITGGVAGYGIGVGVGKGLKSTPTLSPQQQAHNRVSGQINQALDDATVKGQPRPEYATVTDATKDVPRARPGQATIALAGDDLEISRSMGRNAGRQTGDSFGAHRSRTVPIDVGTQPTRSNWTKALKSQPGLIGLGAGVASGLAYPTLNSIFNWTGQEDPYVQRPTPLSSMPATQGGDLPDPVRSQQSPSGGVLNAYTPYVPPQTSP